MDATIANLLEGRVPFTPCEAEASSPAPLDSSAQRPMASSPVTVQCSGGEAVAGLSTIVWKPAEAWGVGGRVE